MKSSSLLLLLVLLAGCVTRNPVNLSLLSKSKPAPQLYSGIKNFDVVDTANNVYRGAQPMDKNDWLFLRDQCHVKYVLKLNTDTEGSDAEAQLLGMTVIKIPITLKQQLFGPVPGKDMVAFFKQQHSQNIYIHCEHGQDRTGLACFLYRLYLDHWTHEQAERDMMSHGFHKVLFGLWKESERY